MTFDLFKFKYLVEFPPSYL